MESEFNSILEIDTKLKVVQIDCYGVRFGANRHFFVSSNLFENKGDLSGSEITQKCLMVRTVRNHITGYR